MKPTTISKPRSDNVARSSGNLPLGPSLDRRIAAAAAEASDNDDDEDAELVAVAERKPPPQPKKKAPQNSTAPRQRTKAARPSKQSPPPPTSSKAKKKKKHPPRHIPVFPIPESIGLGDDDMDSSSSSEEYGAPRHADDDDEDDELEGMWPSVLQAGARLSEARTWAARPSQYHSRKRPRDTAVEEDDDIYSQQPQQPLIQHFDSGTARPTALTALKERMRSLVSEALLPVPPDDASLDFTEGCHRRLVEAIFEIGMSHASPAVIMEHMVFPSSSTGGSEWMDDSGGGHRTLMEQVTSERVKSHLQKYRKNKSKSKEEFLREYDRWTHKALTVVGGISAAARTNLVSTPTAVLHMMGHSGTGAAGEDASSGKSSSAESSHRLLGGDLPAYLTFSVMLEEEYNRILREEGGIPSAMQRRSSHSTDSSTARALEGGGTLIATQQTASLPSAREYAQSLSGARVLLPILSEDERQSSLGISISHVVGLFYSMSHALMKERKKEQQKTKASVTATDSAPPSRAEFPPVRDTSGSSEPGGGAEPENTAKSAAATKPSASSATEPHAKQPRHTSAANDYYAASATPTTTSTAGTSADPDAERRRGPPDDERYPTAESSYAAYGPPPPQHHHHHSSSYETSHYNNHHYSGGTHPPPPYPPPPRYPPPHYSNHPPSSDGHPPPPPPPYNNPAHRGGGGGHYGL